MQSKTERFNLMADIMVNIKDEPIERLSHSMLGKLNPMVREHVDRYAFAGRYMPSRGRIVEAACGIGYGVLVMGVTPGRHDYKGFDIAENAVAYAASHYATHGEFKVGSITALPVDDNSADLTISFETLEHLDHAIQRDALRELARVTKAEGTILISVPSLSLHVGKPNEFHVGLREDADWRQQILGSGLKIVAEFGQNRVRPAWCEWSKKVYAALPLLGRLMWLPHAYYRCLFRMATIERSRRAGCYRNLIFQCRKDG